MMIRATSPPSINTLNDKKRTMDNSLMMLAYTINTINHEGRSALPDAPVVAPRSTGRNRRRLGRLQGGLANILHQAAWAIEPEPRTASRPLLDRGCPQP
jgi:hypothetical protein